MKQMIFALITCAFCASAFAADASMPMSNTKMDQSQHKTHKHHKKHKHQAEQPPLHQAK